MACYDALAKYIGSGLVSIAYPKHFKRSHEIRALSDLRQVPDDLFDKEGGYDPWELYWPPALTVEDLKPGDHVEVQWKNTRSAQFGWWKGVFASRSHKCDRGFPEITVVFPHFHEHAPFYSVTFPYGAPEETDDSFVSYNAVGGLRLVRNDQLSQWKTFTPSKKLIR